jgi:hypothetical protein
MAKKPETARPQNLTRGLQGEAVIVHARLKEREPLLQEVLNGGEFRSSPKIGAICHCECWVLRTVFL